MNYYKELASREGISINQFIAAAVAEKMAALMTEGYFQPHAQRASRNSYESALGQVPDVEPEEYDQL